MEALRLTDIVRQSKRIKVLRRGGPCDNWGPTTSHSAHCSLLSPIKSDHEEIFAWQGLQCSIKITERYRHQSSGLPLLEMITYMTPPPGVFRPGQEGWSPSSSRGWSVWSLVLSGRRLQSDWGERPTSFSNQPGTDTQIWDMQNRKIRYNIQHFNYFYLQFQLVPCRMEKEGEVGGIKTVMQAINSHYWLLI